MEIFSWGGRCATCYDSLLGTPVYKYIQISFFYVVFAVNEAGIVVRDSLVCKVQTGIETVMN